MKKKAINEALLDGMEKDLRRLQAANKDASAGATHAEARAETKWDTCGLEASYLARGHAQQFKALANDVHEMRAFAVPSFKQAPIDVGALVEVAQNGGAMWFYLLPWGGGREVVVEGREVTVITPESPVGAALLGKQVGDRYTVRSGLAGEILDVL